MANKNVTSFIEQYGPIAQQVSKEIGVDANIILSQWAKETRWGQSIVSGTNNLGNIKNIAGYGVEATDNKTKTKDKYEEFEDPEVFGIYYADFIKRLYPDAVNTGIDANAFVKGLSKGIKGSYFEENPKEYAESLINTVATIPEDMQLPASEGASDDGKNDLVSAPNVPPPPTERKPDTSNASPSERLLFGGLGAGLGAVGSGAKGFLDSREAAIPKRAYAEEMARIKAQNEMGVRPAVTPSTSNLITTSDQASRIQQGTTGDLGTTGKQRMGMGEDSAAEAARRRVYQQNLLELQKAGLTLEEADSLLAKAPGMTSTPSGVRFPITEATAGLGPRGPLGEVGYYREPPKPLAALPKPSGLDKVNQVFERMMQLANPLGSAFNTVARRALPTIAAASGGLDLAEIAHELQKPEIDRDIAKIITKGGALGSAAVALKKPAYGVPAALGFTGADMIRERYFGPNKSVMDPLTTQPPPIPRIQPQDIMQDALQQQRNQQMLGLGM